MPKWCGSCVASSGDLTVGDLRSRATRSLQKVNLSDDSNHLFLWLWPIFSIISFSDSFLMEDHADMFDKWGPSRGLAV